LKISTMVLDFSSIEAQKFPNKTFLIIVFFIIFNTKKKATKKVDQ